MEKQPPPRQQRHSFSNSLITMKQLRPSASVWDCDSALYDSFELRSFEKQLDSAINSRTLSMPHLPDRRVAPAPTPVPSSNTLPYPTKSKNSLKTDPAPEVAVHCMPPAATTMSFKISKSVQKFFKSIFVNSRPSNQNNNKQKRYSNRGGAAARDKENGRYFVYDKTGALCTIPEGPESEFGLSPDINSLVKKSMSERFTSATATAVGISRA